jgi:Photosynthetic reaction centre cytochrome C subunit
LGKLRKSNAVIVRRVLLAATLVGSAPVIVRPIVGTTQPPAISSPASAAGQPLSRQEINDRYVQRVTASIAGRESEPAERVFKNIRLEMFKTIPAADLLDIMNSGYSRALDVTCTHCHVDDDFSSDRKRTKRAAREMATMHRDINQQLARMEHLESAPEERFINCGTCHRGALHPQKPPR